MESRSGLKKRVNENENIKKMLANKISPQAHIVVEFIFVLIVASFGRGEIVAYLPFFIYPAVLLFAGGIFSAAPRIVRRLFVALPFVVALGIFGSWTNFVSLLIRFFLSVSSMLIMIEITGFGGFCSALVCLRVPRVMITQLLLMHRYSFLLRDEVKRLKCAYGLRAPSAKKISLRDFGSMAGNLLLRTFDRAEAIHQAMLCRGFDGALPCGADGWHKKDFIYIFALTILFLIWRCV